MLNFEVSLDSIDKVKKFVTAISHFETEFDLICGRYVIDAKSIMGIFSLDLSRPINLVVHEGADMDAVKEAIAPFIVKE